MQFDEHVSSLLRRVEADFLQAGTGASEPQFWPCNVQRADRLDHFFGGVVGQMDCVASPEAFRGTVPCFALAEAGHGKQQIECQFAKVCSHRRGRSWLAALLCSS